MTLSSSYRKLVLTLHMITTMGWLGSAAAYIPIAANVLTNQDTSFVQSAIQIMVLIANFIVVPMAFVSLLTGIALSLGSRWGLFRHYWILFKLVLTVIALFMLVAYTQALGQMAAIAVQRTLSSNDISILKDPIHLLHSSGGLFVVLLATVMSVYKPKGMTKYGWRKQQEVKKKPDSIPYSIPRWVKLIGVAVIVLILIIVILFILI